MKALTIWQPWASLVIEGAKPFEFRGWNPRHRGGGYAALIGQRIVIHAASKKMDPRELNYLIGVLQKRDRPEYAELAAETCLIADKALPILFRALRGELPMSAGLGTVTLGEPENGVAIAERFGVPRANDSDRDDQANWGWPMGEIERWDEPVPMRGAQGFWHWPTPDMVAL